MNSKHAGGRPSIYTQDLASRICAEMAKGASLRSICTAEGMPSVATVMNWLAQKPEFLAYYARAREERAEWHFEDTLEIADDGRNDWMDSNDPENPGYRANHEHIARSKLRIDTRKWFLSRMFPKKYGEKFEVESVQTIQHSVPGLEDLPSDRLALLSSILEEAAQIDAAKKAKPSGKLN